MNTLRMIMITNRFIFFVIVLSFSLGIRTFGEEVPLTGGDISTICLPVGGTVYKEKSQEFMFSIDLNKDGSVEKVELRLGENFDRANIPRLEKALSEWKFHPYQEGAKKVKMGFYLTVYLEESRENGLPEIRIVQNSLVRLRASLSRFQLKEKSTAEKVLVPEWRISDKGENTDDQSGGGILPK